MPLPPMVAGGDIYPHRFVKASTAAGNTCLQAGTGEMPIAVSQRGTRRVPYDALDTGKAAVAGDPVRLFGPTELAMIELGGTVTAGAKVKSDTDGKAVAASAGDMYGGTVSQAGNSGDLVEIYVLPGELET